MRKANRPEMPCPDCGSIQVRAEGFRATKSEGKKRRFVCVKCGRTFYHPKYSLIGRLTGGGIKLMDMDVNDPNTKLRKRYIELAAMLKEVGNGTAKKLDEIINRFVLQMGVKIKTAQEYVSLLEGAGLLLIKGGSGDWEYNEDAEWDLFKITI